jgi:ribosomal protein S5
MSQGLTDRQKAILKAIEAGHTTMRAIAKAAGISSTSVVASNLERLANGGHIVLRHGPCGTTVAAGRDFAAAWDACARLAGNPDA